jgi:4-amino-4-deoxy-L-arabinose transferase-like glycosyltransferase
LGVIGRFGVRWAAFAVAAYFLFFYGMSLRGLISPDEPRYASIAREMAESGDWVTPRLDGEPWFEKPALLYWLGAAGIRLGLADDEATRLASALAAVLFLLYFHRRLAGAFGLTAADTAAAALATAGGWVAFAQAGVFDALLTATFGAAMLALLDWVRDPERKEGLPLFGALLGLAVLAKGLVGPALAALAVLGVCRSRGILKTAKDLFHPRATGPFVLVAAPWYVACFVQNGSTFFEEFLWRHHVQRLFSPEIQHVQPWWFFLPVIAGALLPWTPLLASIRKQDWASDPRARLLAVWAGTTVLFFSLPTNKLPGYVLPALPPLCALIGIRMARKPAPRVALPLCGLLLAALPLAGELLPGALADGLWEAWPAARLPAAAIAGAFVLAAAVFWLRRNERAGWAFALVAAAAAAGLADLQRRVYPALDETAGVRALWKRVEPDAENICIGDVRRHVEYGLNFYSRGALTNCASEPKPKRIEGNPPRLRR